MDLFKVGVTMLKQAGIGLTAVYILKAILFFG